MIGIVYHRGFSAATRGWAASYCPFEGDTDASASLRKRWLAGHAAALAVETPKPRAVVRRFLTKRRIVRKRWPRSNYARRRVQALLGVNQ